MKLGISPILDQSAGARIRGPARRMRAIPSALVSLTVILVLAGGCSSGTSGGTAGKLKVVAGFYPLAEAAMKVGGALVDVQNLTPPGVEPHDLELTPGEIADIQRADVVLYLSGGFAPAVEKAVPDARGITVDLLQGMSLRSGVP